jgi:energy-coupling factor transporter ATP-binding protein EcfA2
VKETPTSNTIHQEVQQIVEHTALVSLFAQSDGRALASLTNEDGRRRIVAVRSELFRDWLTTAYFRNHDGLPRAESIAEAMRQIEKQALVNRVVPRPEGTRRVSAGTSEDGSDTITVQLGNPLGDYIVISKEGWRVVENLDEVPKRGATMLALPRPEEPRDIAATFLALRRLLRLSTEENWRACRTWLIAALRPSGPYPILLIKGSKGSGKSTAAALLRGLIDPSGPALCRLSTIDRSVQQLTSFNWVVALADLTPSFSHLSETLLRMASDRPLILTSDSASEWKPSPEIAKRAIVVELEPLGEAQCSEPELWARFRTVRPQMLAILCATASAGLRAGARDPDSWMAASELVAGRAGSRFDQLSDAICNLMQTRDEWNGRTTELMRVLEATHPGSTAGSAAPKAISERMNGALAAVRSRGVRHEFARGRITLQRTVPLAPLM